MAEVYTAPLAILMVGNTIVGSARNVRVNEQHQLGQVYGIGNYRPKELVRLRFSGSMTVGFYNIDFKNHPMGRDAILRRTGQQGAFDNTLLLQEVGLNFVFLEKKPDIAAFPPDGRDPATGIIQRVDNTFAVVEECFLSGDGFDLTENQISGRDSTFEFRNGIIYLP